MKQYVFWGAMALMVLSSIETKAQYTERVADTLPKPVIRDISVITPASIPADTRRTLFVNKDVTTFIVAGENITLIDLSVGANQLAGNQPGDNIARIKPVKEAANGQDLGICTLVGERNIVQFNIIYVDDPDLATTQYNIQEVDGVNYLNPGVDMPKRDMYMYCWRILNSGHRFYDVSAKGPGIKITLNNIYSIGNYFFLDISLLNNTNIKFDIDEIRIKLSDKKRVKATNFQEIELQPAMQINTDKSFKRDWRNVIVLPKLTFPDEKVLTVTVNEKPITGRSVTLTINYQDVLQADSYSRTLD